MHIYSPFNFTFYVIFGEINHDKSLSASWIIKESVLKLIKISIFSLIFQISTEINYKRVLYYFFIYQLDNNEFVHLQKKIKTVNENKLH